MARDLYLNAVVILVLSCIPLYSWSQTPDSVRTNSRFKFNSVFLGYNFKNEHFFEVGYLKVNEVGFGHHHPFGFVKSASVEFKPTDDWIIGPKVSVSAYGGTAPIAMGVNLIYYFNEKGNSEITFRPEIGFGLWGVKFTYGWNLFFNHDEALKVDPAVFSIQIPLEIKLAERKPAQQG